MAAAGAAAVAYWAATALAVAGTAYAAYTAWAIGPGSRLSALFGLVPTPPCRGVGFFRFGKSL